MIAVLSDIHANIQALEAVLRDCVRLGVDEYWLLGDYVDYGASAVETVTVLSSLNAKYIIAGNHDACLYNSNVRQSVTPHGKLSCEYTKRTVDENPEVFEWLKSIAGTPMIHIPERRTLLVHGTPEDPYWGKFLPDSDTGLLFDEMERRDVDLMLTGHSHISFIITMKGKTIVNPGSVGQPRNGYPQAQYAVLDGDSIIFRRVVYDIDLAAKEIREANLPSYLWERLYKGV